MKKDLVLDFLEQKVFKRITEKEQAKIQAGEKKNG